MDGSCRAADEGPNRRSENGRRDGCWSLATGHWARVIGSGSQGNENGSFGPALSSFVPCRRVGRCRRPSGKVSGRAGKVKRGFVGADREANPIGHSGRCWDWGSPAWKGGKKAVDGVRGSWYPRDGAIAGSATDAPTLVRPHVHPSTRSPVHTFTRPNNNPSHAKPRRCDNRGRRISPDPRRCASRRRRVWRRRRRSGRGRRGDRCRFARCCLRS